MIALHSLRRVRRPAGRAFTLLELLVVLAIIGIILALSLPHFRHMNEGRTMEGAARQLMDDLALARKVAVATRSTVAVVFLPPDVMGLNLNNYDAVERTNVVTLQPGALTSYALVTCRDVGSQPGRSMIRYITPWRHLPDKVFLAETNYSDVVTNSLWGEARFPFPFARSTVGLDFRYVAFTGDGKCLPLVQQASWPTGITDEKRGRDVYLSLASGVIMYTRNPDGTLASWSAQEIPPNNSVNTSNVIHIDWVTGRAKLERADIVRQ